MALIDRNITFLFRKSISEVKKKSPPKSQYNMKPSALLSIFIRFLES